MNDITALLRRSNEELAFWRGYISRWARDKQAPVPERAWQALYRAESQRPAAGSPHQDVLPFRQPDERRRD